MHSENKNNIEMIKLIKIILPIILIMATVSIYMFYTRFVEVKVDISNLADKELEMKREIKVQTSTVQTLSEALLIQKEKTHKAEYEKEIAIDSLTKSNHWQKIRITRQYEKKIDSLNKLVTVKPSSFLPERYNRNKELPNSAPVDRP